MAAPAAKVGDAWINILLSFANSQQSIEKELNKVIAKPAAKAGGEAGKAINDGISKGLKNSDVQGEIDKIASSVKDLDGLNPQIDFDVNGAEFDGIESTFTPKVDKGQLMSDMEDIGEEAGDEAGGAASGTFGTAFLAGIAALGIGALVSNALQTGIEQAGSLNVTAAALNLDEAEIKKVTSASKELFTSAYGESFEAVQEAMRAIVGSVKGARGASEEELVKMGRDVLNLSTAYGLSSEQILKAVQSQINSGFASSFDEAISNITAGFQTMGENGNDFFESLQEYSGDFKTLGLSGESAVNLMNSALDAGIRSTDFLVDALREAQIKLGEGASDEALTALGFDPATIQKNILGGGKTAEATLLQVWSRLQETGDRDLFGQIFGTQAEDYFAAFNTMDLSKVTEPLEASVGDMERFDELMNSGVNSSLKQFQVLIEQGFVDLLLPVLEMAAPLLKSMSEFLSENTVLLGVITAIIGVALLGAIIGVTAALWGMAAAVLANPMTWIIGAIVLAIAALIAGIVLAVQNWDMFVLTVQTQAMNFLGWITSIGSNIGGFFMGVAQNVASFFITIANGLINVINLVIDGINAISNLKLPGGFGLGGLKLQRIANIPQFANGGVVNPTAGGTLGIIAEAGKPEAIVDEGLLNKQLALSNQQLESSDSGAREVNFYIYTQPGESAEELAKRLQEYYDFEGKE